MNEYEMPGKYGWICPRCGKVNAPWMPTCDCVFTAYGTPVYTVDYVHKETKTLEKTERKEE